LVLKECVLGLLRFSDNFPGISPLYQDSPVTPVRPFENNHDISIEYRALIFLSCLSAPYLLQ